MTKDEKGIVNGFICREEKYHYEDFVRYYSDSGPANLGYITGFDVVSSGGKWSRDKSFVTCKKVGRIGDLKAILPPETMLDEVSFPLSRLGARR